MNCNRRYQSVSLTSVGVIIYLQSHSKVVLELKNGSISDINLQNTGHWNHCNLNVQSRTPLHSK